MKVYVQFSDATETKIIASFGCPQDRDIYPNQATLDSGDERYQAFINPTPPTPSVVSMRQAKLALIDAGKYQAVEDAIAAMTGTDQLKAQVEWGGATAERSSPLLIQLAATVGLNDAALDALFIAAAAL
jgi:hypothetical protein